MIRLFGAMLLAAGAVLMGSCAVRHMKLRVQELQNLIHGLNIVCRELGYRMAPLPELLGQASSQTEGRVSEFFRLCAQGAAHLNGRSFPSVWKQAAEAGQLRLEPSDLDLLERLGGILGRYDGESQQQALRQAIEQLEVQTQAAEKQSLHLGKIYRVLSLSAGAFVLILMM